MLYAISNYRFPQITLAAVIKCMQKSYKCFETNPDVWREVNGYGLKLLALKDLELYRNKFPNEEDIQEDWLAVVHHPGKYVNLLVGQKTDEDLREESDEENHYDDDYWDQVHKNYFLAYNQAKAHARWCASRPNEAEYYKRFQVRTFFNICIYIQTSILTVWLFCSFGIASKRPKAMLQGIHWGLIVISILGLSKWWGREVGVMKITMLLPMVPMVMVRPASADSVFSFVIVDSNQIGY